MARIHILSEEVASKIAAGEVVERPASVLKELIENSLDAGASRIDIELENAGLTRLSVRDDGEGILAEDLPKTIIRHATSKIRSADDLFFITSMGFRGEALASIASVSRLTILTQTDTGEGSKLQISSDSDFANPRISPWSGLRGTTVIMEDLFYNVPARLNFLKKSTSENAACTELVQNLMLAHPGVTFHLKCGGKEVLHGPSVKAASDEETMRLRASQVMDDVSQLLFTEEETTFGKVKALISPPGVDRATTRHVFTFINGRYVKDKTIRFAIQRGYHGHLLKGRQPVAYIQLEMDPSLVDVNAHPAKTEVRFQYPDEVGVLISMAIRKVIRSGSWASPDQTSAQSFIAKQPDHGGTLSAGFSTADTSNLSRPPSSPIGGYLGMKDSQRIGAEVFKSPEPLMNTGSGPQQKFSPDFDLATTRSVTGNWKGDQGLKIRVDSYDGVHTSSSAAANTRHLQTPGFFYDLEPVKASTLDRNIGAAEGLRETIPWSELEYIGAFAKCYLMFEWNKKLLVVDQHAFHERVVFERLSKNHKLLLTSQPMMIPEVYTLSPEEAQNLEKNIEKLHQIGFDLKIWEDGTVEIRALPSLLVGANKESLLAELAEKIWVDDNLNEAAAISSAVLETIACHSAVRAGEELTDNHLNDLISQAQDVDFYHNCPHGRRVFRWFDRNEIGRWFDRL